MQTKTLLMALIKNDKQEVLFRQKPEGSEPYLERWYIFGCEYVGGEPADDVLKKYIQDELGIEISVTSKFTWDSEIKKDHDGIEKQFIYLDTICQYVSGEPKVPQGIDQVLWIPISKLSEYDIVPPSRTLLKKAFPENYMV